MYKVERRVRVPFYPKEHFICSLGVLKTECLSSSSLPSTPAPQNSTKQHVHQSVAHLESK